MALPDRFQSIGRCGGVCAASGEALAPGDAIVAALCEPNQEEAADAGALGLVRRDCAAAAWDSGSRPDGLVCFWRTTVPAASEERRPLDESMLLELLHSLTESPDPTREDLRLVLSLVLLRRRRLRLVDRMPGEAGERWVLEHRPTDGEAWSVEVSTRRLSDQESRDVADELGRLLGGEVAPTS